MVTDCDQCLGCEQINSKMFNAELRESPAWRNVWIRKKDGRL